MTAWLLQEDQASFHQHQSADRPQPPQRLYREVCIQEDEHDPKVREVRTKAGKGGKQTVTQGNQVEEVPQVPTPQWQGWQDAPQAKGGFQAWTGSWGDPWWSTDKG
jgi:hypothetical protein